LVAALDRPEGKKKEQHICMMMENERQHERELWACVRFPDRFSYQPKALYSSDPEHLRTKYTKKIRPIAYQGLGIMLQTNFLSQLLPWASNKIGSIPAGVSCKATVVAPTLSMTTTVSPILS